MKPTEIVLHPLDNVRLANLCGALDENIRQIETAFDVTIARRSERFTLHGAAPQMHHAARALRHFYEKSDEALSVDDIQLGLIEVVKLGEGSGPAPVLMTRKSELHGRTPRQVDYLRQIQEHDITFGIGPAGTGKTYLAVASAVDAFEREHVERIVLTRPAVEAGERLGFLPGDMREKVDPYLRPLYDALYDVLPPEKVERDLETGIIEIAPLAFMRGRTLANAFVILDEAQNSSTMQMKMFLTRFGPRSRMVICGDPSQVDLPASMTSGLIDAARRLARVPGLAILTFGASEVVRHPLVGRIVEAYEGAGPDGPDDGTRS